MSVSILILTLNEEANLSACLDTVVGGNPARIIKKYEPQQEEP